MYLLLFFLVPASFVYYVAVHRDAGPMVNLLSYMSGIIAGLCALLLGKLILLFFPADTSSFWVKFVTIFLTETGIPFFGGIIALFFLIDVPTKMRISNIRPQLFGIVTIFLPYIVLTSYNYPDLWSVLILPMLLVSILFLSDYCINRFISGISFSVDTIDYVLAFLPVVLALVLVDLCKTLWFFYFPSWILMLISLIVVLFPFFLRLRKYRKVS